MENTDRNSTAKKDADARRLLEMGGVLKWTFVYAIGEQNLCCLSLLLRLFQSPNHFALYVRYQNV